MRGITYFLSVLFLFSVVVTLENVTNNKTESVEKIKDEPTKSVPRKGPKLNAKQTLMLNQIVGAYALDYVQNPLCKNHTIKFKEGLRLFEPWAIKMFDSSAKLQPGLLVGNTGEFGSFEECLGVYTSSEYGPIRGQMCTLTLVPGDSMTRSILKLSNLPLASFDKIISTLKFDSIWAVCVPDSCPNEDVLRHFNRTLAGITEGLEVSLKLADDGCASYKTTQKPLTKTQWIGTIFLCSIVIFITLCTTYDVVTTLRHDVDISDFYKLYELLIQVASDATWVPIWGSFMWTQKLISTTVTGATVSVDTFFMVSGLLVSYLFLGAMSKGVRFNLILFYLHRYMRVTPVLGVVIIMYITTVDLWGSGPVFHDIARKLKDNCVNYWWTCMLHIQNYINPANVCIIQTWYLTCDMQYYFFSPIVIYPLWKWPNFGWFIWFLATTATLGLNFYLAWVNEYNGGMPVTNEIMTIRYFTHHYTTPYTRASPYLLGIAVGYILHHTKEKKIHINAGLSAIAWITSIATLLLVTLGSLPFQLLLRPYNRLESSIYLTLSRPAWAISLAWVVFNCINGTGGVINSFLSAYPFKVLAKLSYCMFLTHMIVMFTYSGAAKTGYYFSDLAMWYMTCGDMAFSFALSYLLAICVEYPLNRSVALLTKRAARKKVDAK